MLKRTAFHRILYISPPDPMDIISRWTYISRENVGTTLPTVSRHLKPDRVFSEEMITVLVSIELYFLIERLHLPRIVHHTRIKFGFLVHCRRDEDGFKLHGIKG